MTFRMVLCAAIVGAVVSYVHADQIVLKNGDRISGTIESAEGGKLKIKTDYAGELTIDMANIQTFASEHPLEIDLKTGQKVNEPVAAGEPGKILPATSQPVAIDNVKWINHGKPKWTGSITANGVVARGNT